MKKYFPRPVFTLGIFMIALCFSSFSQAQQKVPDKEKYGGTLRVAVPSDFKSLDARHLGASGSSIRGQQQLYNRLVEYGAKGTHDAIPGLATAWKRLDDVTWSVNLRKGVKFHNGKEMTAYDVAKNYDWRINSKKYPGWRPPRGNNNFMQIKSVEALDKYTLRFTLKFPFAPFVPINLGWGTRGIIDPDIVEKYERQATNYPVGTGPFKHGEYVSGSHLILERFNDYWGGKAYLERVILRIIPDAQTRLLALQTGEVDIATDLIFSQIKEIEKDPKLKYSLFTEAKRGSVGNIWFNLRRWPVNDLRFRQAVAMGADWRGIPKVLFPKGVLPVRHTFFERSWLENREAKKLVPVYNPEKARQLLKEVEKAAGKPIPRIFAMTDKGRQGILGATLQIAADQLKKIGLTLDVNILDPEVSKDKERRDPKCDWEILLSPFKGPAIDPGDTISDFITKTQTAGDGNNIPAYNNPHVDELYVKGAATYNRQEGKKIYQEAEILLLKDLVVLPLFDIPFVFAYNKRVHDLPTHDSAHLLLRTAWNNVWLEKK